MNRVLLWAILVTARVTAIAQQMPSWQWAAYGTNTGATLGSKVAVDALGHTCVAGIFNGTLLLGDSLYTAKGRQDVYVAQYDKGGNIKWSHQLGDTTEAVCTSIAVDPETSDTYIAGIFQYQIRLGDSIYRANGGTDMFLVKYDVTGKLLWAKTYGSIYNDQVSGMAINSHRRLVIAGYFANIVGFGKDTLTSAGSDDIFIAQFDSAGKVRWAKNFGGRPAESCFSAAIDRSDNIFLSGDISATTSLAGITVPAISIGLFGSDVSAPPTAYFPAHKPFLALAHDQTGTNVRAH